MSLVLQRSYSRAMPVPVAEVAAALRARQPGMGTLKLHKLLYYCQGHHLAAFGEPLFAENLSAWDNGPVVGALWYAENRDGPAPPGVDLGEAELNTIGYVLSRYGALSGRDLVHLTHSEEPFRLADAGRQPGTSAPIKPAWIQQYFCVADVDDDSKIVLDAAEVTAWLHDARHRLALPSRPDDLVELADRVAQLRARRA